MNIKTLKEKLLLDKDFADAYYQKDLAFNIGQQVFLARVKKGLSQERLANKINTKQSGVARLEAGRNLPTVTLLDKIAQALGLELLIQLKDVSTQTYLIPIAQTQNSPQASPYFRAESASAYRIIKQ